MTRYDVLLGKVPEVKEDSLLDRYHPRFKLPIKGNERLEQLRQWIVSGNATHSEKREFTLTWDLYCRESIGEKPYRENPEYYDEMRKLREANMWQRDHLVKVR